MIEGISFTNTGLPMLILGTLAVVLPFLLIAKDTRSHGRVALGVTLTATVVVIVGTLVLILFDPRDIGTEGGWGILIQMYFRASLPLAMFWAPLLGLVWFTKAQRVEMLRNRDIVREDL